MDPSGKVIPANIVPFEIKRDYTDPASNVDTTPGGATFNGRVCGFTNGSNLTYYYEYSTDCSMSIGVTRTPSGSMVATDRIMQPDSSFSECHQPRSWYLLLQVKAS